MLLIRSYLKSKRLLAMQGIEKTKNYSLLFWESHLLKSFSFCLYAIVTFPRWKKKFWVFLRIKNTLLHQPHFVICKIRVVHWMGFKHSSSKVMGLRKQAGENWDEGLWEKAGAVNSPGKLILLFTKIISIWWWREDSKGSTCSLGQKKEAKKEGGGKQNRMEGRQTASKTTGKINSPIWYLIGYMWELPSWWRKVLWPSCFGAQAVAS